jgi:hypothetical protein
LFLLLKVSESPAYENLGFGLVGTFYPSDYLRLLSPVIDFNISALVEPVLEIFFLGFLKSD